MRIDRIIIAVNPINSFTATGDNNGRWQTAYIQMKRLNEPSHLDLRCLTFSLSTSHINVFPNDSLFKIKKKQTTFRRRQMSSEILRRNSHFQSNGPQCEKTYLLTCAPNEDSNQPAHPRSLIRVFVVRMKTL